MKSIILFFAVILCCGFLSSQTFYNDYVDGVVYFKVKNESGISLPTFNPENKEEIFSILGLDESYQIVEIIKPFRTKDPRIQTIYRIKFDNYSAVDDIIKVLNKKEFVEYAEKSPLYKLFYMPSDTYISEQYYLERINAYAAFDIIQGEYKTKLAIVDDALRTTHPDLSANVYINPNEEANGLDSDGNGYIDDVKGFDVADNDNNPNPPANPPFLWGELAFTHGTHCAGLAGAVTNNYYGIASASFNHVQIIGVKCVKNSSFLPISIAYGPEGVDYAIAAGAEVISMSFGGPQEGFETLQSLIQVGFENGIIFVAAAGNDGNESPNYPAAYPQVIAVGATDHEDKIASFSQRGDFITVVAPGAGIYSSLAWSSEFGSQDGTSMACPLVAGVVALLKSQNPQATSQQIIDCLIQGCDNIDEQNPNLIGKMGAGRVNVYNSLICLQNITEYTPAKNDVFGIYPNPANDQIFIHLNGKGVKTLKIRDISGKIIYSFCFSDEINKLNVGELTKGFYILETENDGKLLNTKLIKN